jgi:hypothetical protein
MNISTHDVNGMQVAEMSSEGIILRSARDATDLIGQLLGRGIKSLILHDKNLCPEFWQFPTGLAGEIMQKFANYNVAVAFVGEFDKYKSKSLQALMHESNLGDQAFFTNSVESAISKLSKKQ